MDTRTMVRADAREFQRIGGIMLRLLCELAKLGGLYAWTVARGLICIWWCRLQDDRERVLRGWR